MILEAGCAFIALVFFLLDGFRVPAKVNWVSLGFAFITLAVFFAPVVIRLPR